MEKKVAQKEKVCFKRKKNEKKLSLCIKPAESDLAKLSKKLKVFFGN